MDFEDFMHLLNRLDAISIALDRIAVVFEKCQENGVIKTKDVERAQVYGAHLGKKLRSKSK